MSHAPTSNNDFNFGACIAADHVRFGQFSDYIGRTLLSRIVPFCSILSGFEVVGRVASNSSCLCLADDDSSEKIRCDTLYPYCLKIHQSCFNT